jgi:hypothetical protein
MQRILKFKNKISNPISFSFTNKKIYIAIHYDKDSLEPVIFNSLTNFKIANEYIATLYYALGIIEELKLNLKIWSKQ